MADLTITASEVAGSGQGLFRTGTAFEAISAGKAVYLDAANGGKVRLADADALNSSRVVGIALNNASAGQPVEYLVNGGTITVTTSTFASGVPYYVSTTAGGLAPYADLGSGDFVTLVGIGTGTTSMRILLAISGVAIS